MIRLIYRLRKIIITVGLIIVPAVIHAQQKEPIPDGTQGETFPEERKDSIKPDKFKYWNEFDGSLTTLKIGGGLLYDAATYIQDDVSKDQLDKIKSDIKVRDCRFTLSGKFKFNREVTWKIGVMYDGAAGSWYMRETGIMVKLPEIKGHIFVGRTKEGYSMTKVMNGYSISYMERAMTIDIIPILADGIKYMGYFPKARIFANVGIFNDIFSDGQSFSTYNWQFVTRVAWLPIFTDMTSPVMHIGFNYRRGHVFNNEIQVRSRPEVNPAPYFVDTKKFKAESSDHIGGEFYYRKNKFLIGTEFNAHMMNAVDHDNPVFTGGEIYVAYTFTGEVRPYMKDFGIFGFLKVKRSVFDGGPGLWEGIIRFSNLDLTDGMIAGGEVWRLGPEINWYLSDHVKFFAAYGYTVLNRFGMKGTTNIFQARIMYML